MRRGMALTAGLTAVVLAMGAVALAARPTKTRPPGVDTVILDDYLATILAMAAASSPITSGKIDDTTLSRGQEMYAKLTPKRNG